MDRCQKCNTELPAKAGFCAECGFSQVDIDASKSLSSSDAPQSLPQSTPASEPASQSDTPQPTILAETPKPLVEPTTSKSMIQPDEPNPVTPSGKQNQGQAEIDNMPTQTMVVVSLTVNRAWTNAEIDNIPTDYIPLGDIKIQLSLNGTNTPLGSSPESFVAMSRKAEIMDRCQKCNTELPAKAGFCAECGFSQVDIDASKSLSSSDAPQSLPQSTPASEPASQSDTPQPAILAETPKPLVEPVTSKSTIQPDEPDPITPSGKQNQGQAEIDNIPTQTMAEPAHSTPSPGPTRTIGPTKSSKRPANPATPAQQDTVGELPGKGRAKRRPVRRGPIYRARGVEGDRRHRIRQQYQQSTLAPVQSTQDHPASTGNLDRLPTDYIPLEDIKSQLNLNGTNTPLRSSPESFTTTSEVAEHWRNSWRDRQRAEAGAAEGVSRDQAFVPPMAMQNSLARMRTIESNNQKQSGRNKALGFWMTVFLVVCLVGGLGVYIISTYLPNAVSGAVHVVPPSETAQPALSLQGPQSATIKQAQTLILHGEHFGANDTIRFLLDTITPIKDSNGKIISVQASDSGRFDVPIPIQGSDWSAGPHSIQAVDDRTKQNAYLIIVLSPTNTPEATSPNLALSMQGKPVTKLTFNAVVGQGNPNQQRVTLTNTSGSQLHWTATANAAHNLSWLLIDDNHTTGKLDINSTDSISIGVLTAGLKSNPPTDPYTGQIVFTINGQEQLTLPVELQVADPQPEIVFSPNPVVALLGAGKTCQLTALTLINVGNSFIDWTLVPYDHNTKDRIQFMANGQTVTQGMLAPSGESGDTQILNLKCNGVSAGDTYKFTMYAGSASWLVTIFIRTSS